MQETVSHDVLDECFTLLPLCTTCRLIDFDYVRIEPGPARHSALLVVSGVKHWINLEVWLLPRCYQTRPDFWAIEVIGTLPGCCMPALVDYNVTLPLDNGIRGALGIEIVGATKSERRLIASA